MIIIKKLFTRRWILATLLAILAMVVLVRLGFWQLDRLHQRREMNAKVINQINQPALNLSGQALEDELTSMEYRKVVVEGVYDPSDQVVLINQVYNDLYGASLFTPLRILNSDKVILVDRGWIPGNQAISGSWSQYDEPGLVKVSGVIRLPQSKPDIGHITDPTPVPGGERIKTWNLANLSQMAQQMPSPLMGIYIQESPDPSWTQLPYRTEPELDLTDGPHLGYALQWFTFAAILAVGYPLYVQREEQNSLKDKLKKAASLKSKESVP